MSESKFRDPAWRRSALVLAGTILFALVLVLVTRAATAGAILRGTEEARQAVMVSVAPPDTTAFSQLPYDPSMVDDMYAAWQGESLAGYCVEVTSGGFGGPMKLMVGVSAQGSVTGVAILSHSETPGLGDGVDNAAFLERFLGLSGTVRVGSGANAVAAVSGATESSRAVAQGVNQALAAVAAYSAEGGAVREEGEN
ncbi:FMN-binding protein [uncultured Pseudoflavonifractor sp.]|uniref:FMN-binding protein n=1 Tax=uncultured Pseudoflavonifractor sp. TaxID=1221379 RepID=UPI0025FE992E|nr:FMN-binding protein [uncultured Pseudoflavonifractor sp.]